MDSAVTNRLRTLAASQDGVVTLRQVLAFGARSHHVDSEIRSGRWRALLRGVYLLDADMFTDAVPARTWWRAALLAHGPEFCLVGGTGARAFGVHGLPLEERTIEVAGVDVVPRCRRPSPTGRLDRHPSPEIVVRQLPVTANEVVTVNGLPVRRADLTIVDAGLVLDRPGMLSVMDSGLHLGLVSEDQLRAAVSAAEGRPGIQDLRALMPLADARAESTVESRVRLACIDGDVAPDDLQYVVRTPDGHVVGIGDLGWHKKRRRPLLAEADGESVHGAPKAVYRDRLRGNALAAEACDTVRFVYADAFRPYYVASVVRAALAAG